MKKSILLFSLIGVTIAHAQNITITEVGRYTDGRDGACEISTYDAEAKKLYTTNAAADSIDIVSVSDLSTPTKVGQIDVLSYGGGVNSVLALGNGYVAAAIEANTKQDSGFVVFFDTAGTYVGQVTVGALPDMITMTHDGEKIIVANEGEPDDDYLVDPEGSIAIIDISGGVDNVTQADVKILRFTGAPSSIPGSLKKPGTTWAVDLEPEYVAVNESDDMAWVICQEANMMVIVDLTTDAITGYKGLGFKDFSATGNELDPSNKDSGIKIQSWDVKGVYQPDAIYSYTVGGNDYVVSANEGDGRDYDGYSSETRIADLDLDSIVFPNAAFLQEDSNLGRLKTFTPDVIGDANADMYVEELYAYGARSFSIWDASGNRVYDSGSDFEKYIETNHADFFNCDDGIADEFDERSDDKGPEPEAIVVGKVGNDFYAFVGLERQGGIMVYNVTDPMNPSFETFLHTYDDITGEMIDIAPEGLLFIDKSESPDGKYMLVVSNEVSGTTTIYSIDDPFAGISSHGSISNVISTYPNPTNNVLTIEVSNSLDNNLTYQIFNVNGSLVSNGLVTSNKMELDLSHLSEGIYNLIIFENGSLIGSEKVIKN